MSAAVDYIDAGAGARSCLPEWYPDRRFVPAAPDLWKQACGRLTAGLLLATGHGPTRRVLQALGRCVHPAWSAVGNFTSVQGVPAGVAWRVAEGWLGYRAMPLHPVRLVREKRTWREGAPGEGAVALCLPLLEAPPSLGATCRVIERIAWPDGEPAAWVAEQDLFEVLGDHLWEDWRWEKGVKKRDGARALRLNATPASWAAATGDARGVCLLDRPVPPGARKKIRSASEIVCDGPEHAAEVHALMKKREKRHVPALLVPESGDPS